MPDLDRVISEDEIDEILGYRKSLEEDRRRQAERSQEESAETDEMVFEEDSNGDMQDNQIDEQQDNADGYILDDIGDDEDEIETDEELIRQEAKKNNIPTVKIHTSSAAALHSVLTRHFAAKASGASVC